MALINRVRLCKRPGSKCGGITKGRLSQQAVRNWGQAERQLWTEIKRDTEKLFEAGSLTAWCMHSTKMNAAVRVRFASLSHTDITLHDCSADVTASHYKSTWKQCMTLSIRIFGEYSDLMLMTAFDNVLRPISEVKQFRIYTRFHMVFIPDSNTGWNILISYPCSWNREALPFCLAPAHVNNTPSVCD